jgi:hypothetical protein
MSDKKQTAVEWQFDELQKAEKDWWNEAIDGKEYNKRRYLILKQSKEMEKQQQEYFFRCGRQYQLTGEGTFTEVYNETYER